MLFQPELAHERTLVGAVDSFLGELVHVRPYLRSDYSEVLESMTERWIEEIGINRIDVVEPQWLGAYIATAHDRTLAMNALHDFYKWAIQRDLIDENPLDGC